MKRALLILGMFVMCAVGMYAAVALAGPPNTPPPGQNPCDHGNGDKNGNAGPCKPDPQPNHGKDCDKHGKNGGVNEDHCKGVTTTTTTTTTTPPPPTTTTVVTTTPPPPPVTTTVVTTTPPPPVTTPTTTTVVTTPPPPPPVTTPPVTTPPVVTSHHPQSRKGQPKHHPVKRSTRPPRAFPYTP